MNVLGRPLVEPFPSFWRAFSHDLDVTPWHFTWAIRFCGLRLDLPDTLWLQIARRYQERAPEASKLGKELLDIMNQVGWCDREQVLDAMIQTRNALALDVQGKVLVLDPTTAQVV